VLTDVCCRSAKVHRTLHSSPGQRRPSVRRPSVRDPVPGAIDICTYIAPGRWSTDIAMHVVQCRLPPPVPVHRPQRCIYLCRVCRWSTCSRRRRGRAVTRTVRPVFPSPVSSSAARVATLCRWTEEKAPPLTSRRPAAAPKRRSRRRTVCRYTPTDTGACPLPPPPLPPYARTHARCARHIYICRVHAASRTEHRSGAVCRGGPMWVMAPVPPLTCGVSQSASQPASLG